MTPASRNDEFSSLPHWVEALITEGARKQQPNLCNCSEENPPNMERDLKCEENPLNMERDLKCEENPLNMKIDLFIE